MTTKVITAAVAGAALLFSTGVASAAASSPRTGSTSVATVKAPVSGVRAKRALKKKSNVAPLVIAAIVVAGAGAVAGTVVAVTNDTPASP
ncbi:MAG: hypothetical protein BVN32_14425 [Proteobacteria bacterium ST_bin14]|nr:MAG: hypothetical protein BVN32_14425 [Proteobacteria bacterium ST_bin14]